MEGSNDVQDSITAADMCKPVQETGGGASESSIIVGNVNGILLKDFNGLGRNGQTFPQIYAESEERRMDESSSLYAEPSQEVGYNNPSALVIGTAAIDPEVIKGGVQPSQSSLHIALMAVLLKSEKP